MPGREDLRNIVQVFYNGIWGTICDQPPYTKYLYTAADLACTMLGFRRIRSYKTMYRPDHYYGPPLLWNITCPQNATTFRECNSNGWYNVPSYCQAGHNQLYVDCGCKLNLCCIYVIKSPEEKIRSRINHLHIILPT